MLSDDVYRFIDHLRYEKRASIHTISSYSNVLKRAVTVLEREFDNIKSWQSVGLEQMRAIQRDFNFNDENIKQSNNSVAHDLYALSSFFKYLIKQGELSDNPCSLIKAPKVKRHLPKILTLNEIDVLLDYEPKDVFEQRDSAIAENYDSDHKNDSDSKTYTDKELNAYKKKNKSKLQSVDIKMFECDSEDDAKAFKKALKADGSNFAALASKYSSDDFDKKANKNSQETTYNDMTRSTMEGLSVAISTADDDKKYPGLDWLYSSDRKAGDVRQDSTSVVYVVKPVYMSDAKTVNVRHILIAPESSKSSDDNSSSKSAKDCTDKEWAAAEKKAKSILAKYNSGDKTSKSFAKLAKSNSSDGNASDGGLYENIIPNQMVPTFNAWCFDSSRKVGDVGIVKTEYGYHIMYFEGKNDQAVWKYIAQQKLAADDTQKEHDSITLKKNWFGSRYLEIDTDIDA